jgi:hypothetical protein
MKKCNLCGSYVVQLYPGAFGYRCVRCRSTFIHRAMGKVLDTIDLSPDSEVHEFSAHGAIFRYLNKRFRKLSFSEYFDDVPGGGRKMVLFVRMFRQLHLLIIFLIW